VILILLTLLAVAELIADKLPKTPARTAPLGLTARVVLGCLCAVALATSAGGKLLVPAIVGVVGALIGTFAGYKTRHTLVFRAHAPDFAVAIAKAAIERTCRRAFCAKCVAKRSRATLLTKGVRHERESGLSV
jgi:uncharacterized membrane protein